MHSVTRRVHRKIFRDNPILDRLIEVGTKALRRGLMSGETLRAPRQQLRRYEPPPSTPLLRPPKPLNSTAWEIFIIAGRLDLFLGAWREIFPEAHQFRSIELELATIA